MARTATRRSIGGDDGHVLEPPKSGLVLWLKADAGVFADAAMTTPATADGTQVGGWADQSGAGNHFTQSTATTLPTLQTDAGSLVNGLPVIKFDGSNDYMSAANFSTATAGCLFAAYRATDILQVQQILFSSSDQAANSKYVLFRPYYVIQVTSKDGTTDRGLSCLHYPVNGSVNVVAWGSNGAQYFLRVNAESPTLAEGGNVGYWFGGVPDRDNFILGALRRTSVEQYTDIEMCELLLYDGALTDAQIRSVERYLIGRWNVTPGIRQPAVYLTFDDCAEGVYDLAYPYMAARDMRGTVYMVSDLIDDAGFLTSGELQALDAAGWDIGNHAQTHTNLTTLTLAQQTTELSTCKSALDALGLTRASDHVAYPLGAYNADTLTAMANLGMATGRTISEAGITLPVTAEYEITSYKYYTTTDWGVLSGVIAADFAAGRSVMLYMHNIVASGPSAYDLLYTEFTTMIDWLYARRIDCRTITQLPIA